MKTLKYLQKIFLLLFIGVSMCAFQACNDDEDEIGSIIEGKIFTRTYNTGGESGEDGWRASITETLFFKANGVVLYKYVCQKTWWSPDDVGADTYNKSHQGTYTEKGNTIVVSGIPSSSDTDGIGRLAVHIFIQQMTKLFL